MRKRHIILLIALAFLIGTLAGGVAWAEITNSELNNLFWVYVNGKELKSDPPPKIIDGRIYVPLRAVSEYMGATVGWDQGINTAYIAGYVDPMDIPIEGPKDFKKAMHDAMVLLRDKDPEAYRLVGRYIRRIVQDDVGKPTAEPLRMLLHVPKKNFDSSYIYWWAGTLAHEAKHGEQCYSGRKYTREQMEMEAGKYGLQVLINIKAPKEDISIMENMLKTKWWND
ncbi:MAG: copper amine oxidase N-terminal domain-containing protein [Bacillota bacterium]